MPRQRRLLFYTHALVGGGAERVWALLASQFHLRGEDVAFAVDFEADDNRPYLHQDVPVTVLGRGHLSATRALARLLDTFRPDVAFAAVGASDLKLILAAWLASHRPRLVLSVHGGLEYEERFLGRLRFRLIPLTSRLSERTIAVAGHLREALIRRWLADAGRIVHLPNPVLLPPAAVVPSAAVLAARPAVVVTAGRLIAQKDHATALRAFALSKRAERLVVLGDGPERPRLEALAAELAIDRRVDFPGYLPEPWPHFAASRALLHSSTSEAFGNVLVEALGHGLPVASTDTGGPREILADGRDGQLAPVGDHAALAAALDAVLADGGDPQARRRRAEFFGVETATARYADLVEDVMAGAAAAGGWEPLVSDAQRTARPMSARSTAARAGFGRKASS